MKITVPTSLEDITLETYLKYEATENKQEKIAILLGISLDTFRNIEKPSLKEIDNLLSLFQTDDESFPLVPIIEIDNVKLGFIPDLHRNTLGEFGDLETLCAEPMKNLVQITSILYREVTEESGDSYEIKPYTTHEDKERVKKIPMSVVMGMLDFFLSIGIRFAQNLAQSSMEMVKEAQ